MNFVFASVIRGMGELDTNGNKVADSDEKQSESENVVENIVAPDPMSLPYLLLDIRDSDAFEESHIIGGKNFINSYILVVLMQWYIVIVEFVRLKSVISRKANCKKYEVKKRKLHLLKSYIFFS